MTTPGQRRSARALAALAASLLSLPPGEAAEPGRSLRVASFPYYPGIFLGADGRVQGLHVDLLTEMARLEGWQLEFVHGTWAEGLGWARHGEVDLITSVAFTPERATFLDYGSQPILTVWGQVFVRAASPIDSILDMRGKRVAVMQDDYNARGFEDLARAFKIECELVVLPDFEAVFRAVERQEVDAGVVNSTFGSARHEEHRLRETGIVFNPFPIFFAVPKGRNAEVLARVDAHLAAWRSEPSSPFHEARQRWDHGTASAVKVVPRWLLRLLAAAGGSILLSAAFIALLRRRVKRATAEIRAREERLGAIFETARDVGFLLGDAQGTIVAFSPGAEKILGYPRDEVVGKMTWAQLCPKPPVAGAPSACERDGAGGEVEMVRKDGRRFPAHLTTHRVPDGKGGFQSLGVCIDLSERRALEAELVKAQQMESVGRLAGGIAHDFNNLLQAILGYTDLALEQLPAGDPTREDIQEIRDAALRSAELTRQLLAFARKQPAAPRPLALDAEVRRLRKAAQGLVGEGAKLSFELGAALWPVRLDPLQVDQVLINLLANARDALPESGGSITVQLANETVDAASCASRPGATPGDYVVLSVRDTGCGIPEAVQRRIFEPFFTTKPVGKGTGLGLPTVDGIAKQNGGFVLVDSQVGAGSRFRVYFPRGAPASEEPAARDATASSRGSETVLVVEDERQLLDLARRALERQGYAVIAADSPERALALLAKEPRPIRLLVTDMVMPGMSGRDLWERLRAQHPELRCVVMSGYTEDLAATRCLVDSGVPLLRKPFALDELERVARAALDGPVPARAPAA